VKEGIQRANPRIIATLPHYPIAKPESIQCSADHSLREAGRAHTETNIMSEIQHANDLIRKANQCHSRGEYEQAIAFYRQAIDLMPDSPIYRAYYFIIGETLMKIGRYQEAVPVLEQVVEDVPEHAQAWCDLGQCLMLTAHYHEAARAFERCLEIAPGTAEAWYYGAMVHARLGRGEQAREYLHKALSLKPAWKKQAQKDALLREYLPNKAWWKFGR